MGAPDAWRIGTNQLSTPRRSGHHYKSRQPKKRLQQHDECLSTHAVLQHSRGGGAGGGDATCSVATGTTASSCYSSSSISDSSQQPQHRNRRSHHQRQFEKAMERRGRHPSSCKVIGVASPSKTYRRYDDSSDSDFHSCSETEPPTSSDSEMDNNVGVGGGFFQNSHREATSLFSSITGFTAFTTEGGDSSISGPSSQDEDDENRSDRARRSNNASVRTRNKSTTRRSRRTTRTAGATMTKSNKSTTKSSEHQRGRSSQHQRASRSSPSSVTCKKSCKSKKSKKRSSSNKSRKSSRSKSKKTSSPNKPKLQERKVSPQPSLLSSFAPKPTILSSAQSVAASTVTNPFENSPIQAELEPDMCLLADAMNLDSNTRTMLAYYDARTVEDFCLMSDRDFYDLLSKAAGMNRALPPLQIRKVEVLRDWIKELMNKQRLKNKNKEYMDDGIPTLILGCRTGSRYEPKSSSSSQSNLPRDWSIRLRRDLPKLKLSLKTKGEGGMTLLSLYNYANLWPIRSLFC